MTTSKGKPFSDAEIRHIRENHPKEHSQINHMFTVVNLSIKETRHDAFECDQFGMDAIHRYGISDARSLEYTRISNLHIESAILDKAHKENLEGMISQFLNLLTEVYDIQEKHKSGSSWDKQQNLPELRLIQCAAAVMRNMTSAQHEWSQKWLDISSKWDKEGAEGWMRKMQALYPGCFGAPKLVT